VCRVCRRFKPRLILHHTNRNKQSKAAIVLRFPCLRDSDRAHLFKVQSDNHHSKTEKNRQVDIHKLNWRLEKESKLNWNDWQPDYFRMRKIKIVSTHTGENQKVNCTYQYDNALLVSLHSISTGGRSLQMISEGGCSVHWPSTSPCTHPGKTPLNWKWGYKKNMI
jgi:hypothetical protein